MTAQQLSTMGRVLEVTVERADGLPHMDKGLNGTCDAYCFLESDDMVGVDVSYGNGWPATPVVSSLDPCWDETLLVPQSHPALNRASRPGAGGAGNKGDKGGGGPKVIRFAVFDHDASPHDPDDLVGHCEAPVPNMGGVQADVVLEMPLVNPAVDGGKPGSLGTLIVTLKWRQ